MCQIIRFPNFNLSFELIASIYKSNSDGLGSLARVANLSRFCPKNAKEAWRFYETYPWPRRYHACSLAY